MKKILISLSLVLVVTTAFTPQTPEAKYKVENTVTGWQSKIGLLEYTKNAIKNSDMPSKVALPLIDSLSAFENDIIAQVQPQMPKDTTHKK